MFKFLKEKLKQAVEVFSKKASEEIVEEMVEDAQEIEQAEREERKEVFRRSRAVELPDTEEARAFRKQQERMRENVPPEKPVRQSVKPSALPAEPTLKPVLKNAVKDAFTAPRPVPKGRVPLSEIEEPLQELARAERRKAEELPKEKTATGEDPRPAPKSKNFLGVFKRKGGQSSESAGVEPAPVIETTAPAQSVETTPGVEGGFFGKLKESFTKKQLTPEKFDELFWELELSMLENNVAVEVIEKIKADLKRDLTSGKVTRKGIDQLIVDALRDSLDGLFIEPFDLVERVQSSCKRPFVIVFVGVNGSGKTTTLAKVANLFQENDLSVVIAAADTFRAAAIDQLKEHADKLSIKLVSQGYGADPAAVAFDAVEHAKAKQVDVVMIDTAGRLHSNTNLMSELQKVVRVAKPDLKIFIGESITGNDCVEQAKEFDKLIGIDAIILSKADVDEKGGAAISVSYVTGKPILYLGVGQTYGDLKPFDKDEIIEIMGF